jgi:hypothetical protein
VCQVYAYLGAAACSRSARCLDSVRGGENGIFEAIIGGEVLLYFAQALRDGTRK